MVHLKTIIVLICFIHSRSVRTTASTLKQHIKDMTKGCFSCGNFKGSSEEGPMFTTYDDVLHIPKPNTAVLAPLMNGKEGVQYHANLKKSSSEEKNSEASKNVDKVVCTNCANKANSRVPDLLTDTPPKDLVPPKPDKSTDLIDLNDEVIVVDENINKMPDIALVTTEPDLMSDLALVSVEPVSESDLALVPVEPLSDIAKIEALYPVSKDPFEHPVVGEPNSEMSNLAIVPVEPTQELSSAQTTKAKSTNPFDNDDECELTSQQLDMIKGLPQGFQIPLPFNTNDQQNVAYPYQYSENYQQIVPYPNQYSSDMPSNYNVSYSPVVNRQNKNNPMNEKVISSINQRNPANDYMFGDMNPITNRELGFINRGKIDIGEKKEEVTA